MENLRKGLKKGDKFMDGKKYFVVDKVLEHGKYLSHEIPAEEAEEKMDEMPTEDEKKDEEKTDDEEESLK